MFYAAIILILLGVLVFVYSVSVEKTAVTRMPDYKKYKAAKGDDNKNPEVDPLEKASEPVSISVLNELDEVIDPVLYNGSRSADETRLPQKISGENSISMPETKYTEPEIQPAETDQAVVLFEDSSGAVEYRGAPSEIDETLEKYNKIKRIGEGSLSAEKNGISFHIDKKLYRFDYHRISELNTGGDYIAVRIGDQPQIKLFIFREGDSRIEKIAADYASHKGDDK